jgi:hypothetical protein
MVEMMYMYRFLARNPEEKKERLIDLGGEESII